MNIRRKLRAHTEIHTGPLNDILFILLLFFLIAATLANPNLVKVNNPKGSKDMKAKQNIVVSVNKEHQYFIGTSPVDFAYMDSLLKMQIEKARRSVDTPTVVVNADTIAYVGEVYQIMSMAKKHGAKVGMSVK
ncbi:MAG TPA: biopolymer transporter ExbD [Flavisolibacter sp.]|jgi:biopolymer transport protein ExbD|nr:biopolymer transporter ExbD [Flavisolibacter sp.]